MLGLLVLALSPLAAAGGDSSPLASGLVRAVEVASVAPVFVQHFRLDRAEQPGDRPPLGLARYVAGPDAEGGLHVELELDLHADGVRLIHVEQESWLRRRIVFRELGAQAGRTLFLEGEPAAPLLGYELGGPEVVRRVTDGGGLLPLVLIESLRRGAEAPAELRVLDPLSATFEPLQLVVEGGAPLRVCEARRADGSLRWRVSLSLTELTELRFQEHGPRARPISPEDYERWRERHERETRTAREAAAARSRPWDALVGPKKSERPGR